MLSSDETRSGGKTKDRKARPAQGGDKAGQRKRKAAASVPEADQSRSIPEREKRNVPEQEKRSVPEQEETSVAAAEVAAPPLASADTSAIPAAAEDTAPVSYRAFADAWRNYSRTSMEQTRSYFEKLAGVRSLGAALEVQAEFAKQACETFVAQSQKIGELQGELTKQRLKRLEGFMQKMTGARSERQS
jgi:hypothetical protein